MEKMRWLCAIYYLEGDAVHAKCLVSGSYGSKEGVLQFIEEKRKWIRQSGFKLLQVLLQVEINGGWRDSLKKL